ncbi:MAG: hypothetical protein IPP51_09780 [Bacteroidetes bacterium]|nr:hypothetical protein [Bacteroidota bacterium]
MSFYIAIIAFIGSVISGLILLIVNKDVRKEKFVLYVAFHGIFLFGYIASLILKGSSGYVINYFFTGFVCSAIILSGLAWRSDISKYVKYYFTIFTLTIPMFLLSPSMVLNFILTSHFSDANSESFLVEGRIYLERQNTVMSTDDFPHYKMIRKKGFFHATIQRDIVFGGKLDSIKVLDIQTNEKAIIRGYTSTVTHVSSRVDSMDVEVHMVKKSADGVEYRL